MKTSSVNFSTIMTVRYFASAHAYSESRWWLFEKCENLDFPISEIIFLSPSFTVLFCVGYVRVKIVEREGVRSLWSVPQLIKRTVCIVLLIYIRSHSVYRCRIALWAQLRIFFNTFFIISRFFSLRLCSFPLWFFHYFHFSQISLSNFLSSSRSSAFHFNSMKIHCCNNSSLRIVRRAYCLSFLNCMIMQHFGDFGVHIFIIYVFILLPTIQFRKI